MTTDAHPSPPAPQSGSYHETLAQAGTLLRGGGRRERREARTLLEGLLRDFPEEYPPLDLEAELLVEDGEAPLAQRLLEEYLKYMPEVGEASERLAWVFWHTRRREEAVAELQAALARQPELRRARRWLVEWAPAVGKPEVAAAVAREGLDRHPGDVELLLLSARAAELSRDEGGAERHLRAAWEQAPANEEALRALGRHLVRNGRAREAAELLESSGAATGGQAETRLLLAEALLHISNRAGEGLALLKQLVFAPDASEEFHRDLLEVLYNTWDPERADSELIGLAREHPVPDSFALELTNRFGARRLQSRLRQLWELVSARPLQFPRTTARYLSTHYQAIGWPARLRKWVQEHWQEIEADATLWGGVGAWHVERGKWKDAESHLSRYSQRPGVRPWMILLLARACEATGKIEEASKHLRAAVAMEPDHSEVAVRSRLAFNLAMEGMGGAGQLILLDCSEKGRELASPADFVRIFAVESLLEAAKLHSALDRKALFDDTLRRMRDMAASDPGGEAAGVITTFQQKVREVLMRSTDAR